MLNNIITNNVMSVVTIYHPYSSSLSPNEIIKLLALTALIISAILIVFLVIKTGDAGVLLLIIPCILIYLFAANGVDQIETKTENTINKIDKIDKMYEAQ